MKRILCMCPVPKSFTDDADHFDIGFAVSDPYLAYAIPIYPVQGRTAFELHVSRPKRDEITEGIQQQQQITWTNLPETQDKLLTSLGYRDLGAVALALPMKTNEFDKFRQTFDGLHLNNVRDSMRRIVRNYQGDEETRPFNLLCYVEDRLTVEEAKERAKNEPEIWEEVQFESKHVSSMNACVALNSFLYRHNGGGWPNTFG